MRRGGRTGPRGREQLWRRRRRDRGRGRRARVGGGGRDDDCVWCGSQRVGGRRGGGCGKGGVTNDGAQRARARAGLLQEGVEVARGELANEVAEAILDILLVSAKEAADVVRERALRHAGHMRHEGLGDEALVHVEDGADLVEHVGLVLRRVGRVEPLGRDLGGDGGDARGPHAVGRGRQRRALGQRGRLQVGVQLVDGLAAVGRRARRRARARGQRRSQHDGRRVARRRRRGRGRHRHHRAQRVRGGARRRHVVVVGRGGGRRGDDEDGVPSRARGW